LSIEILSLKAEIAATRIRQFFKEIENDAVSALTTGDLGAR
jgi:hypothetical protein